MRIIILAILFAITTGCMPETQVNTPVPPAPPVYDPNGPTGIWLGAIAGTQYNGIIANTGNPNEYQIILSNNSDTSFIIGALTLTDAPPTLAGMVKKGTGAAFVDYYFTAILTPQTLLVGQMIGSANESVNLAFQNTLYNSTESPIPAINFNKYVFYLENGLPFVSYVNYASNYYGDSTYSFFGLYNYCNYSGVISREHDPYNLFRVGYSFTQGTDYDDPRCPKGITHNGFAYVDASNIHTYVIGSDAVPHHYTLNMCPPSGYVIYW